MKDRGTSDRPRSRRLPTRLSTHPTRCRSRAPVGVAIHVPKRDRSIGPHPNTGTCSHATDRQTTPQVWMLRPRCSPEDHLTVDPALGVVCNRNHQCGGSTLCPAKPRSGTRAFANGPQRLRTLTTNDTVGGSSSLGLGAAAASVRSQCASWRHQAFIVGGMRCCLAGLP